MTKKSLLITVLFILLNTISNAQTIVGLEDLSVPDSGYYNGSTDHSGTIGSSETFTYAESGTNFNVTYTQENGYGYWSGFAYSNQTDLTTADHTNYSAYSPTGGGAGGSTNYIIAYLYGSSSISFDTPVNLANMQITNSVWAYKYMSGEDGTGHDYENGDYLKLSIKGVLENGSYTSVIDFYLADFTNGNTTIINDWTTLNLSGFDAVVGLEFQLSAVDTWTPYYFCMDNLTYQNTVSVAEENTDYFSVYPIPATTHIKIDNIRHATLHINDLLGKTIYTKNDCLRNETINSSTFKKGVYYVVVKNKGYISTKKIIIQ